MEKFDVIIIGGGSAGYAAARTAREVREKVAIIDNSIELGGLCILRGCMPSKTLIYSAEVLHLARHARLFGLDIPTANADMGALHARKVRMINEFKAYRQQQLQSKSRQHLKCLHSLLYYSAESYFLFSKNRFTVPRQQSFVTFFFK